MADEQINFHGDDLHQSILNKAAQDKFLIVLDVPPYLRSYNDRNHRRNDLLNLDSWRFSPSAITIPTISTPSVQVPFGGQTIKMTAQTRPAYTPLQISFQIDNNFNNYHFLWMWQAVMNHPTESGMDKYWDQVKGKPFVDIDLYAPNSLHQKQIKYKHSFTDYKSKIVVFGLREYNEPIVKFTFFEAFPTEVAGIDYNYANHELLNSRATFDFNNMDVELLDVIPEEVKDPKDKKDEENEFHRISN